MLKSVDVLIGLTVVLLALSLAVTVITQSLSALLNTRGRHLRRGLTDLLQQLDPALTATVSKAIATKVLTHPLVSGSNSPIDASGETQRFTDLTRWVRRVAGGPRLGNVVHREEFTKLLLALAAGRGTGQLETDAKTALATALANSGVANPDATLKGIRALAMELERSSPELSNMARQNMAILRAAESDFVATINNWFDQTMDRTSQRFTASTRAITFVGAFIVAFGLQVDTPSVVNRLAADDALRADFVSEAKALYADQQAEAAKGKTTVDPTRPDEIARKYGAFLATNGIITLPSTAGWKASFSKASLLGMLVTALLLSLGAPFWYSALGKLLQLRSVLAEKEGAQRAERQLDDSAAAMAPGATRPAASIVAGERGDLTAIG